MNTNTKENRMKSLTLALVLLSLPAQAQVIDSFEGVVNIECVTGYQNLHDHEGIVADRFIKVSPCPASVHEAYGQITVENENPEGQTFVGILDWLSHPTVHMDFVAAGGDAFEVVIQAMTGYWSVRLDVASDPAGTRQIPKLAFGPGVIRFPFREFHKDGFPDIDFSKLQRVELQLYSYGYDDTITIGEVRVPTCEADLNHDGVVGAPDYLLLVRHWGEVCE